MDKSEPSKKDGKNPHTFTANSVSGGDLEGQSLLPMLIGGLVLIFIGMVVVVVVT
ncbi:MAG: hypothetical protein AB7E81_05860 [Hyphomicrobiaceae bacterium]